MKLSRDARRQTKELFELAMVDGRLDADRLGRIATEITERKPRSYVQMLKFLTRLAGMSDGDRTLLDSTTVLFGSGIGDANTHKNSDLPIILAGGGYRHGEFRQLPASGPGKVPLCNLFVDIAQRMGLETASFGTSTGRFS